MHLVPSQRWLSNILTSDIAVIMLVMACVDIVCFFKGEGQAVAGTEKLQILHPCVGLGVKGLLMAVLKREIWKEKV